MADPVTDHVNTIFAASIAAREACLAAKALPVRLSLRKPDFGYVCAALRGQSHLVGARLYYANRSDKNVMWGYHPGSHTLKPFVLS